MKNNSHIAIALITLLLSYVLTVILFLLDSISLFAIERMVPFLKNDLFLNCSGGSFWLNCEVTFLGWMFVDVIILTILIIVVLVSRRIKR